MPYDATEDAGGEAFAPDDARQMIETASAFAQREMLPEARQALQRARSALAQRGDVGPAHWCNACLVALEIAARGGDVQGMEAEAAQLRSLSGGGRYWSEQARARIGKSSGLVDPARLDRVFAVLAGEAVVPSTAAPSFAEPPQFRVPEPRRPAAEGTSPGPIAPIPCPVPPVEAPLGSAAAVAVPSADEGDHERSQRVLAPAADLATRARVPAVLLAWQAAGDPAAPPGPEIPEAPAVVAELEAAAPLIPDFPIAPPAVDLTAPRGMAPTPQPRPVDLPPPAMQHAAPEPLPQLDRRLGGVLKGIVVAALVAGAAWMYLPAGMKVSLPAVIPAIALPARGGSVADAEDALRDGDAARALEIVRAIPAESDDAPRLHLVRGHALLATGDTAAAVDALAAAARSDNRGSVAWAAAEALARLPGHEAAAAEAYLLAFAAGFPAARAETVARAQELAGHLDRARRVREHAAKR